MATVPILEKADEEPEAKGVVVEIDFSQLQADLQDEEWQGFLRRAKAYRQELRRNGRLD